MDENAFGYEDDPEQPEHHPEQPEHHPGQPEHYWHRRAAILVAGLGLISLLAWALSPSGGKSAGAAARASQPSSTLSPAADSGTPNPLAETSPDGSAAVPGLTSPGTGGASTGTGSASPGTGRASPASAGASSGTASPGGARASDGTSRASSGSAAAPGTGSGQRCSPGAVVLSLFSKSSYADGRDPGFAVDAVSTAPGTCTFDLGPGQVQLVVMSAGRIIWDSGDCPRGDGAQPALLSRGVPVQETITWNRAVTLPGCVILASSAPPGTYEVQARAGTIASSVHTFRLAR